MADEPTTPAPTFAKRMQESSQLESAVYIPAQRELRVVFKSTAAVYAYLDFPPDVWQNMLAAPSLGSFVHRIKGQYQFDKRVQPVTLEQQAKDYAELLASLCDGDNGGTNVYQGEDVRSADKAIDEAHTITTGKIEDGAIGKIEPA